MRKEGELLENGLPFVSVIIVHYTGRRLIKDCLESVSVSDYPPEKLEVIVVDNGPLDGSAEFIQKKYPWVRVLTNDVNNYARANNLGIKQAKGEYVALLNNDTKVERNWLSELVRCVRADERVGAAGSKVLFFDGSIQSAGHEQLPNYHWGDRGYLEPDVGQFASIEEVISVSNAAALYRKSALLEAGFFDENFNMYLEDLDMNWRLREKGFKVLFVPQSIVFHRLHGSRQPEKLRQEFILKNRLRFLAKHFPGKFCEQICGTGDIIWLDDAGFAAMLDFVAQELRRYWKGDKELEASVTESLKALASYRARCQRIGKAGLRSLFRDCIIEIKRLLRLRG